MPAGKIVVLGLALALLLVSVAAAAGPVSRFRPAIGLPSKLHIYPVPIEARPLASADPPAFHAGPKKATWSASVTSKVRIAVAYLEGAHQISAANVRITDAYTDGATGITHVYARQTVNNLDVANGLANVDIDARGRIISSSQSFVPMDLFSGPGFAPVNRDAKLASLRTALQVMGTAVKFEITDEMLGSLTIADAPEPLMGAAYGLTIDGFPDMLAVDGKGAAVPELMRTSEGQVARVWHICLQQLDNWWSVHISSDHKRVEALNNWAYAAESYRVLPRTVDSPDTGEREIVVDPAFEKASPKGWVSQNHTTAGNNVWAQSNPGGTTAWLSSYRPDAGSSQDFDFPFNASSEPQGYVDYSVTQLFYTVNMMHDLSYVYGFDEAAGNFQNINFSGLGEAGDYIIADSHVASAYNDASFFSPPDGQHGRMKMHLWNRRTPKRDGSLEQNIVVHEFTHGISSRLTGGPSNADCLANGEAAGLGEGWSDTVANIVRIRPNSTRALNLDLGVYSSGQRIRKYPYSTSLETNPSTYQFLNRPEYAEVHNIGEVWASMLYEVLWNLIDAHGISEDLFAHDLSSGNALLLQLLLDAMKLQPCGPSFFDARDAIIHAEANLTGGNNRCRLWQGFTKRGLGVHAAAAANQTQHTEDFTMPGDCRPGR